MSFYVLDQDKQEAKKLHNFIVKMRSEALAHTVNMDYSKAEKYEIEANKAIDQLQELQEKRLKHERNLKKLVMIATEIEKDGFDISILISEGRKENESKNSIK